MTMETTLIEKDFPEEMPVPKGKYYGVFNGMLQLLNDEDVKERYALAFEEMPEAFRRGIGLFKLPEEWLPKGEEKYGTARWREEHCGQSTAYYY